MPAPSRNYYLLLTTYCLLFAAHCLLLTACTSPRPTLKLGLVAPFEGRYRDIGYEVIYAVRLAVREANEEGGVAGFGVELVALDDGGDPTLAAEQARKLAADPQVLVALGHWLEPTTQAAAPEYAALGLPSLATTASPLPNSAFRVWPTDYALQSALPAAYFCPPPCASLEDLAWLLAQAPATTLRAPLAGPPLWAQPQFAQLAGPQAEGVYVIAPAPLPADSADPSFAERYRAIATGVEPRIYAVLAYDTTRLALAALARDIQANGQPTRAGLAAALSQTTFTGLSGNFSFDANHNWAEAHGWVYRWQNQQLRRP